MESSTEYSVTTRSVGIRYGLMLAGISVVFFFLASSMKLATNSGPGQWAGIVFMVVLVVLAQQYFKEKGNGYMSYSQGIGIGFWVTLISSLLSGLVTYVYTKFVDHSVLDEVKALQLEQLEAQGLDDEQMELAMSMMDMITTPGAILVFSVIGGVVGGVLLSLIITLFTQKNNTNPF